MNKLDKKQLDEKDRLDQSIHDELDNVEDAINTYNEKVAALFAELITSNVEKLNTVISEARDFVDALKSDAQDHYDEKSEGWQEGEKGQSYQEWIGEMESVVDMLEDVAVTEPDELTMDDVVEMDREVMSNVPDEPS